MTERHTLTLPNGQLTVTNVDGRVGLYVATTDLEGETKGHAITLNLAHLRWLASVLNAVGGEETW